MSSRKILYIQVGVGFIHVNKNVIAQLQQQFPTHTIELFDVLPYAKSNPRIAATNLLYILKEYFGDFISGKKKVSSFKYHFLGTTYIFNFFTELVRQKIKSDKYDFVVQSQSLCNASGNGVPVYVYTDHTNLNNLNYKFVNPDKFMRTDSFVALERKVYKDADLVFVMSQNIRNSLVEQYKIPASKVKLVYVGSNTSVPSRVNLEKYKNKNIIFVGKEWERKGGPLMVEAFKKVLDRVPDATLTIVGCKPDVNVKNCEVVGEVSLEEVARHYDKATVFCLPTVREPFGIVFIEAMFNRLPIVTNRMGATPYLVTPANGYLLDNNADDYCEILVSLITNPGLCEELGDESVQIAEKYYTWENVGSLMAKYIRMNRVAEEAEETYSNSII